MTIFFIFRLNFSFNGVLCSFDSVSGSSICLSLSFTWSGFGKSEMQIIQNRSPVVIMLMKGRFFVRFPILFILEKTDSAPLCLIKAITAHCVI